MEVNKKVILYIGNNLTTKTKYATTMDTLSRLLVLENYIVIKSSSKVNKLMRLLDMCISVIRYSNKIDYLLIDTFSTSNFFYAFFTSQIARILKLNYIPILHGGNLPYRLDKSKRFSNMIFNNSFVNVAPSNYLKTEFESRGYKTKFIPNIIEIQNYNFKKRDKIQPNILWVRAFKELYNPKMAVKVLSLIKMKYKSSKLCMIGPFKDTSIEETKQLSEELGLLKSIKFTGVLKKEEWHKLANDYDIFINTTNFDNTPVSVIEAMALGLTVVSTNAGGMPYLIENGKDGIIVDKNDHEKMAKEIITLIQLNNQQLSLNARLKSEKFGWNVVKQQWEDLLNSNNNNY